MHPRRGTYSVLNIALLPVLMGFGALAVDIALVRLAQVEAQAVADAASQAGLLVLRSTGNTAEAQVAVDRVIAANTVAGRAPAPLLTAFGTWDGESFVPDTLTPNAVRVRVGQAVDLPLASILGYDQVDVWRQSTSASRALHLVLVMDITNSWDQDDFDHARAAALEFLDTMYATAGPHDRVGMALFTGQFGVEYTPMLPVRDVVDLGVVEQWEALRTASKAGTPSSNSKGCNVYTGGDTNDFSDPEGGCFPQMWREYQDESGTDHTTGLTMARTMLLEQDNPNVYRALVLLTDGSPNGTGYHRQRGQAGFVDDRWRFYKTDVRRSTSQVISGASALASASWNTDEIHQWCISFVTSDSWMERLVYGDGYYMTTTSSSVIVDIFTDIAESMPLAVVE